MTVSLKIVAADDDPLLLTLLQLKLEAEGHEVTLAADGHEALRLASTSAPDLLVMDIVMPGIDGLTVTGLLRAQPRTATLPIVLMSGMDSDRDIVVGWQSGASYYLTKPFEIEQLRYFIKTFEVGPVSDDRPVLEVD